MNQHLLAIDKTNPGATEVTVALQSFLIKTLHLVSEDYHLDIQPHSEIPLPKEFPCLLPFIGGGPLPWALENLLLLRT